MRAECPLQVDRLAGRSLEGELDGPCFGSGVRSSQQARMSLRDADVVEEFNRLAEIYLQSPDGALTGLVFLDHPELIEKGRLLHVGDVRDYEDLPERPLEPFEGQEYVGAPLGVKAAEDLVEDQKAQTTAALGGDDLGESDP